MKRILSVLLAVIMIFTITACSQDPQEKEVDSNQDVSREETSNNDNDDHYPVSITTYNYQKEPVEITFEEEPEKVLAVYQNSIETLFALGLEDKIVAAAGLDHDIKDEYKDSFKDVKYYDNPLTKEEVIGISPDFILSWYSLFGEKNLGDVDFWHERDINTYIAQNSGIKSPNTLENEYEDILNIGKIFNVEDKAEKIVDNMKKEIEEAKEFSKDSPSVKTVILEVGSDNMYRIYGEDSIGGNIASKVGADLVAKENGNIGAEDLVDLNPEVIFTVYFGDEIGEDDAVANILDNSSLDSISAVKDERVYPIMLSEVYASGIRTLDGIISISNGLYPEKDR